MFINRFAIVQVGSEPVLCDVIVGKFMPEHFPKLFQEAYARDSAFLAWNFVPPADLDVWTFWSRLLQRGISFVPGSAKQNAGAHYSWGLRGVRQTHAGAAGEGAPPEPRPRDKPLSGQGLVSLGKRVREKRPLLIDY